MFSLGRSNRSSTATVVNRGVSPLSSDGRRLTISPSRRARIRTDSGRASGSNADGVITTRAIGLLRFAKSAITSSISSMLPSTGMFRINWPRSAADGDNRPTGQIRLTAPLSIPRACIAEIAVGEARGAEKRHFEKPEENNRYFAEKERTLNVWRDKNIIQHQ